MKSITKLLLGMEEGARNFFSRIPFIQAFLAGVGVIIFWRGIWEWLDNSSVSPLASVIIGTVILVGVGVFLQTFIGNTIIIKSVKQEEQQEKKVLKEIAGEEKVEEVTLIGLSKKLDTLLEQTKK
jgi:hypothetical protein